MNFFFVIRCTFVSKAFIWQCFRSQGCSSGLCDMPYFVDDFRTICFLCVVQIYLVCHPEASRFLKSLFSIAQHQSLKHLRCCRMTPSWCFQVILLCEQRLCKTIPEHSDSWELTGIEFAPSFTGHSCSFIAAALSIKRETDRKKINLSIRS